jgi:SPP1 family predicted phage head-tail adaptor
MRLRSGHLNRLVSIRVPAVTTRSTDGEPIYGWTTLLTEVWADKQPLSGRELFAQDVRWSEIETKFIIRYNSTSIPTPQCRLYDLMEAKEYEIKAIIDIDDEQRAWELLARRVT